MKLSTIILAAGLGTRMKSLTPKVLHKICGKPIIQYVIDSIKTLKSESNIVVINPSSDKIRDALKDYPVVFAVQKKLKGTGDALKSAVQELKGFLKDGDRDETRGEDNTVLVLSGDTPLINTSTLKRFLDIHEAEKEDISIISFITEGSHSYGRIVREKNKVSAIVEDKDADKEQKKIREVNSGIYAMKSHILNLLKEIKINEKKREYYLTDIVEVATKEGYKVNAHILGSEMELTGINTREDLHKATLYLRDTILTDWMRNGVSFMDTASVFIHPEAKIGTDTVIYPNVHIEGKTIIGSNCIIYPNTRIIDAIIGSHVTIKDCTVVESSTIKDGAAIGPFAHIRAGSVVGLSSKIGNFVEIKKSVIGDGVKASHLSYLGDAEIGKNVNIGAGTITCNYDGERKHKTAIEDNAFVGSDTQLVAPVRIGKGAYIGAGSTITKDVPPLSLATTRVNQKNIENWAIKKNRMRGSGARDEN